MAELMTEAEALAAAEWVMVMGMQVPMFLKEEMAYVARQGYPELTAGKDDDAACVAVTMFWWIDLLARIKSAEAEAPVVEVIEAAKKEYAERGKVAKVKALHAASLITPAPAEPPVDGGPEPA